MTLFTSDSKEQKPKMGKTAFIYLLTALFCILFGAVYEHFSHQVYSTGMIYAFVFPLAGGTLPFMVFALYQFQRLPGRLTLNLYHSGIAALTVGSIMTGVLEIYGTTNALLQCYWVTGIGLTCGGVMLYLFKLQINN